MGERTTPSEMVETSVATRSSVLDALKGLGGAAAGVRVDKEELRRRILIPADLAATMREAIKFRDPGAAARKYADAAAERAVVEPPEAPLVVFVNSRSGGRHGPELMARLQELMGEYQVFDLSEVKPSDFVQYALLCLEKLAESGDVIAKVTRERLRVVVAGGDGTVGWVLGCLGELYAQNREPVPPTAIIPLGTGNDLSRSFNWGGSFPFAWRSAVKRSLLKAAKGPVCRLDSWHVTVTMPEVEKLELPHSLRHREQPNFSQEFDIDGNLPDKVSCFEGVFYNYFSIGMDAQVAYGFHHLRDKNPNLARGPVSNKLIYSGYSCTQGWFFTPCATDPSLRGLRNILRIYIKKVNCSEWEVIPVPKSVRSIVCLNLHNYGSGRNPWGHPKPEYLEKRGFVEAHLDDGLLEIFGLKQGWHASVVMVELITAKRIAQISPRPLPETFLGMRVCCPEKTCTCFLLSSQVEGLQMLSGRVRLLITPSRRFVDATYLLPSLPMTTGASYTSYFGLLQLGWKSEAVRGEEHTCRWMGSHGSSRLKVNTQQ
ncbi:diacylglycerol kinase 4 isoform X1 [Dendrobium catenatum]|uniref:diacylglycerol kinase 4 isoform X1 n=1 Tax=Dendrobium catenatum TaxID=906689 RepID=UPI00109FE28D|nr:diacylglycerol kinase 4 isoform X1 [Dendrobium catenatum]